MNDQKQATLAIESLYPRSLRYLTGYLQSLVRGRLWLKVLIGMVLGITVGIIMGPSVGWLDPTTATVAGDWLAFPGKLFLAQVFGVEIGTGGMALIVLTAVGASIGAPATPGVGIVILAMILDTVGIPLAGIALIMGVDRILDMSRTAINVSGDLVAARVMDRWVGSKSGLSEELAEQARHEEIREQTGADVLIPQQVSD